MLWTVTQYIPRHCKKYNGSVKVSGFLFMETICECFEAKRNLGNGEKRMNLMTVEWNKRCNKPLRDVFHVHMSNCLKPPLPLCINLLV